MHLAMSNVVCGLPAGGVAIRSGVYGHKLAVSWQEPLEHWELTASAMAFDLDLYVYRKL